MIKAVLIRIVASFVEVVHVELPDKGRKVTVLEELVENFVGEFVGLFNNEAISFFIPTYHIIICGVL